MFRGTLDKLDDRTKRFLEDFRKRHEGFALDLVLNKFRSLRVMVIGDTIIDRYTMCRTLGKSSKSPTINCQYLENMNFAGGALAIANHLSGFVDEVRVVTVVGDDGGLEIVRPAIAKNVVCEEIIRERSPTTIKQRFVEKSGMAKMFEVSFMDDHPLNPEIETKIILSVINRLPGVDIVLVADFGHGMLTPRIFLNLQTRAICQSAFLAVNVQTNSANFGFNPATKYYAADYTTLDENEIRLAMGSKYGNIEELLNSFRYKISCPSVLLTLGREGNIFFDEKRVYPVSKTFPVPAFSDNHVIDTLGAGDAVFAITSLFAAACPDDKEIIPFIGSCVGSLAVEILGNSCSVKPDVLRDFVQALLS